MTDPYATRARTHRSDGIPGAPLCTRCSKPYPCASAGKVDPEARRGWLFAALLGAMGGVGALCVLFGGLLLGWWSR